MNGEATAINWIFLESLTGCFRWSRAGVTLRRGVDSGLIEKTVRLEQVANSDSGKSFTFLSN